MLIESIGRHLAVASVAEAQKIVQLDRDFWHVISIYEPGTARNSLPGAKRILYVSFDDVENPTEDGSGMDAVFSGDTSRAVPCGAVVLTPTIRADSHAGAVAFYQRLHEANRALRCDFFEGVVMKRAESVYPVQMRSSTEECRGWVKHRFLT